MRDWLGLLVWFVFCVGISGVVAYSIVRGDGPPILGVLGL